MICTTQWFLEYSQSCAVITTILFWNTFINWKKESYIHYLFTLPWPLENINWLRSVLFWKSQFLRSLIRSLGSLRRRKGSGGSQGGDRGLKFSKRRKGQTLFSIFLSLSHIKHFFFSLSLELMIAQQNNYSLNSVLRVIQQ